MTMTSDEIKDVQNQMVFSKLAETVEAADYRGSKIIIINGMPLQLSVFNLFFLGIVRCESRSVYESSIPAIRELWEEVNFKYEPVVKKKPIKLGIFGNWSPSPEYLEKLPDNRLIDTVLETINNISKVMDPSDPSVMYTNYKAIAERVYELVY